VNRAPVNRYLAGAAALAAAGLAAAGCGSSGTSSSAASSPAPRTGTQSMSGSVAGQAALTNAPTIRLTMHGLVNTTATVHLTNTRQNPVTFKTPQGNLTVTHTAGTTSSKLLSAQTCRFEVGQRSTYTVVPGKSTGTFKGATGNGTAVFTFTGDLPKKNGKCDTSSSAQPSPQGLRVSFAAHGPMTLK
jgi:hypothetical protein